VRSVAVDAAGTLMATGADDGRCAVYDLALREGTSSAPRWVAQHNKADGAHSTVWVVAVSPDGRYVAAGDYANAVRVYAGATGALAWEKTAWEGKGPPFTWGLHFSGDSSTLAIAHWDGYAYVVDTMTWAQIASLKREDRVYSVSLDHAGALVAAGGRDKLAVVYRLTRAGADLLASPSAGNANDDVVRRRQGDPPYLAQKTIAKSMGQRLSAKAEITCRIKLEAFIYSVSLTSEGDRLAVGAVDNTVYVGAAAVVMSSAWYHRAVLLASTIMRGTTPNVIVTPHWRRIPCHARYVYDVASARRQHTLACDGLVQAILRSECPIV
jgi:DNA-binding beta-propeller fold protein YncE